ncbi:siderophore-interacting protein [Cellulomonas bogoriensis]|uniref:FAD-binding protein n=1 Tax=Cellulomonas bogoriensis 69B4 = DSM 16987 TaxID=1386082 RepID=A0A0A0C030_9CELL|nr:siderophore-interacting protein [Cellulomonas bogoriensis]KGM13555.1 FAD-binding protein [Cellulomonas bogoriensis 69B4 = DSM 16987]
MPLIERHALDARLRRVTVARVEPRGAGMRRVVFEGPDLDDLVFHGPSDHAKVFFPTEPDGEPAVPTEGFTSRNDPRYVCREYTVRRDVDGTGLVMGMALHEDGPAGRWAAAAEPGRVLGVYGPKTSKVPPLDLDGYLLVADLTGLPAVTNWLGMLADRPGRVHVVVEVQGPEEQVELPTRDGVTVTWVHRGATPPGTGTHLRDAVAATPLPSTRPWVWAGAEASVVRDVRRDLLARSVERQNLSMTGYWRAGVPNFDHKAPLDDAS